MTRAEMLHRETRDGIVFIEDVGLGSGCMSITNDAEAVVQAVTTAHGRDKRVVYRDTEGRWDELAHEDGILTGFRPYSGWTPDGDQTADGMDEWHHALAEEERQ